MDSPRSIAWGLFLMGLLARSYQGLVDPVFYGAMLILLAWWVYDFYGWLDRRRPVQEKV